MNPSSDRDNEYRSIATILDSLDAVVYVCDMQTYELLFFNQYGRSIWGDPEGRTCWKVLQAGQSGPCDFCTNDRLLDDAGNPTGVYVWEFQNTVNHRWYQCRDQAIRWIDGRLVRMEIATDITERKQMEDALRRAKEEAERLACIDALTGLNNRRAFFEQGEKRFRQAQRFDEDLSVMMLDMDHFKTINDRYGHGAGDQALANFGKLLREACRDIDIAGRLGGEEFALILPGTDLAGAAELAERLQRSIRDLIIIHANHDFRFTVSIGLAQRQPRHSSLERLISDADKALYHAKRNGRDCIESLA